MSKQMKSMRQPPTQQKGNHFEAELEAKIRNDVLSRAKRAEEESTNKGKKEKPVP